MSELVSGQMFDKHIVSRVNLPTNFWTRPFTCAPGFNYGLFRKTSAGLEFISSYGPNERVKLRNDEELYRVPIGEAIRHIDRKTYGFIDGTIIELEAQLDIAISDPARVLRLAVQNEFDDPLQSLETDVRHIIAREMSSLSYDRVFLPEGKEINLDVNRYAVDIKQGIPSDKYGLTITDVQVRRYLPAELKKRWEDDIASWQTARRNADELLKRRESIDISRETANIEVTTAQIEAERRQQLRAITEEEEDHATHREWEQEDKRLDRQQQLRQGDLQGQQNIERSEVQHDIDIRRTRADAERDEERTQTDFRFDQQRSEQTHQLLQEAERRAYERRAQLADLQHQVSANSWQVQIEDARRRQEELEKNHQLQLRRIEEQTRLQLELLESNQKLLLTSQQNNAELAHQFRVLDYQQKELDLQLEHERRSNRNAIELQAAEARIEMGKQLVKARVRILEKVAEGDVDLPIEQLAQLVEIDPISDRTISVQHISDLVDSLAQYLEGGGSEKIRTALSLLSGSQRPALSSNEIKEEPRRIVDSSLAAKPDLHHFTHIRFPEKCILNRAAFLSVQLTLLAQSEVDVVDKTDPKLVKPVAINTTPNLAERTQQKVALNVMVSAPTFTVDKSGRVLIVPFEADSEILKFELRGRELGQQIVEVEFFHGSNRVGYVVIETEVVDSSVGKQ